MNGERIDTTQLFWRIEKLGNICKTTSGGTPSRRNPKFYNGKIPWVKSGELDKGLIIDSEEKISEEAVKNSSAKIFRKGTLLIALYGATIGKMAFLGTDAATNQAVCGIFESDQIDSAYLYHYLYYRKPALIQQGIGGAQPNISQSILRNLLVPLPPIRIQKLIVSKIEELFSELDKGKQQLETALQQLKIYRQAVLKAAFEGSLTAEWRLSTNHPISAKETLLQVHLEKLNKAVPSSLEDNEEFAKLPEEWCWVKPGDICSPEKYSIGIGPFGSNLKVSDYTTHGTPLIFVKNITRRDFSRDLKYISSKKFKELAPHSAKEGDLIITKMGDPPGDCEIYPENLPDAVITSDCLKFRVWNKFANNKFYKYCIETDLIKKQLGLRTRGVAQKKISLERFRTIVFPFPSLIEQERIVLEIESRLSVCDKMEETIKNSLAQAEALRQSILKKAFEGKLI